MKVMKLTNLQSSFLLFAILFFFFFSSAKVLLRHLVMKNKRTRVKAAGFSSGLLHIPSISTAVYGLKNGTRVP